MMSPASGQSGERDEPAKTTDSNGRARGRRAQRPATDGVPETERADHGRDSVAEDENGHEGTSDQMVGPDPAETWWREQRPPHWE